ncbi:hypothetical protein HAX54_038554 [Datura stramonium]|uniref:Uncharacterized protein n=1 Tax=Datura stramonium TaxID=4076 RepID=A0ABS8SI48_DATST|nr:hypothetical protein [Datura stramonium]
MSGASRVRSMNVADSEARPVLGPAGNKAQRRQESLYSNISLSASCSSDASTDSFHSSASTGRIYRMNSASSRRKQLVTKSKKIVSDDISDSSIDGLQSKKRCAWVTPNTVSLCPKFCRLIYLIAKMEMRLSIYANFHDEEWEFQSMTTRNYSSSLSFVGLNSHGLPFFAKGTYSELKLRGIIENARQMLKVNGGLQMTILLVALDFMTVWNLLKVKRTRTTIKLKQHKPMKLLKQICRSSMT